MSKPKVELIGRDGNAFAVLAACEKAARKAGWTKEQREAFDEEAKSGDYNKLLQVVMKNFEVVGMNEPHEYNDLDEDEEDTYPDYDDEDEDEFDDEDEEDYDEDEEEL